MFTATVAKYSTLAASIVGLISSLSSLLGASPSHAAIINGGFVTAGLTGQHLESSGDDLDSDG